MSLIYVHIIYGRGSFRNLFIYKLFRNLMLSVPLVVTHSIFIEEYAALHFPYTPDPDEDINMK